MFYMEIKDIWYFEEISINKNKFIKNKYNNYNK